jgi:hypothetical protein
MLKAFAGLSVILSLLSCTRSGAQGPPDPATAAAEFIRLYAGGQLTGDAAAHVLGNGATAQREGRYWQIESADGLLSVVIGASDLRQPSDDVQLRVERRAELTLGALEHRLGKWEAMSPGEFTSVIFHAGGEGRRVLVFVRLFTAGANADSPVQLVQPRTAGGP